MQAKLLQLAALILRFVLWQESKGYWANEYAGEEIEAAQEHVWGAIEDFLKPPMYLVDSGRDDSVS